MRFGFRRGITGVILSILAAAAVVSPALAVGPDAGQLLNQERQTKPALPKRLPTAEKLEPERLPQPSAAVQVEVKGFRFSGIEGLATEAELQKLLQGSIGQKLDFAGLERLQGRHGLACMACAGGEGQGRQAQQATNAARNGGHGGTPEQ